MTSEEQAQHYKEEGNRYLEQGLVQEALTCYEEAIKYKPNYPGAHNNKGVALGELGQWAEAVKAYETALGYRPGYPDTHYNKGNALSKLGQWAEAVKAYEAALGYRPDYFEAHCNKGVALGELGQWAEAVKAWEAALGYCPDHPDTHHHKGVALLKLDRYPKALESARLALFFSPNFRSAWQLTGETHLRLNHPAEAQQAFERYFSIETNEGSESVFGILKEYRSRFDAPLLVDWLLEKKMPELVFLPRFASWWSEIKQQRQDDFKYLAWLDQAQERGTRLSDTERLRETALMYLFRGNPIRTRELLDTINRRDKSDLMAQYYFVQASERLSLQPGDTDGLVNNAVEVSREYLASGKADMWQTYYAGHLLAHAATKHSPSNPAEQKPTELLRLEALGAFARLDPAFLPGLYMAFWVYRQASRKEEAAAYLQRVLEAEEKLAIEYQAQESFLVDVRVADFFAESPYWKLPFRKYACANELSEPIQLVRAYLDRLKGEKKDEYYRASQAYEQSRFLAEKPYMNYFLFLHGGEFNLAAFLAHRSKLTEQERAEEMRTLYNSMKKNERIDLAFLKNYQFDPTASRPEETENRLISLLSSQIDHQDGYYHKHYQSYTDLVAYLYCGLFINTYTYLTATYFLTFRASIEFAKKKIEDVQKRFNQVLGKRSLLNKIIRYSPVPVGITDVVGDALKFVMDETTAQLVTEYGPESVKAYLKTLMANEDSRIEDLSYRIFRRHFPEFVAAERQRLGEEEFTKTYQPVEWWYMETE